jgi:hypothetical protein
MIKYSSLIPKLTYNGQSISDITHRFVLTPSLNKFATLYTKIEISDTETPEAVSLRVYGSTNYWWLILAINNVIDPLYDWVMTENEVYEYAELLYGVDGMNEHRHYEDENFVRYSKQNPEENLMPVTQLEWMIHLNDIKRKVNVISQKYLPEIEKIFKDQTKAMKTQVQEFK